MSTLIALIVCVVAIALIFTIAWALASYVLTPPPLKAVAYILAALISLIVVFWLFGIAGPGPAHIRVC